MLTGRGWIAELKRSSGSGSKYSAGGRWNVVELPGYKAERPRILSCVERRRMSNRWNTKLWLGHNHYTTLQQQPLSSAIHPCVRPRPVALNELVNK